MNDVNYNAVDAQSALAEVARWIGNKRDLTVQYHNGTAVDANMTKGIIRIPAVSAASGLTAHTHMLLRGQVYHEAGHIAHSVLPANYKPQGARHLIINALEDCREETVVGAELPGCRQTFDAMNRWYNTEFARKASAGEMTKPLHEAMSAAMFQSQGIQPAWKLSDKAQAYFDATYETFTQWRNCQNTADVIALADRIMEILREQQEQNPDQQDQQQDQSQQGEKSEDQQQGEQGDDDSQGSEGDDQSAGSDDSEGGSDDSDDDAAEGQGKGSKGDDEHDGEEDGSEAQEGGEGSDEGQDSGSSDDSASEGQEDGKDGTQEGNGNSDNDGDTKEGKSGKGNLKGGKGGNSDDNADIDAALDRDAEGDDLGKEIAKVLEAEVAAIQAATGGTYTAYRHTDRHEEISVNDETRRNFDSMKARMGTQVTTLTRAIEQALRAITKCRTNSFLTDGDVDMNRLVAISQGTSRNIYCRTKPGVAVDTAISIVLDESGSMYCGRSAAVRNLAIALGEALSNLRIPFEIVGTTTTNVNWDTAAHSQFTRSHPMVYKHYKSFNEEWTVVRSRVTKISSHENNIDGEAVEYAASRLAGRKEARKIVLSLTDGEPCGGEHRDDLLVKNLMDVLARVRKAGIEVYGFGIQTRMPEQFYGKQWFVELNEIGPEFCREFARIIGRGSFKV